MANPTQNSEDFRAQIPQHAYVNALVIQDALIDGDLYRSLRERTRELNLASEFPLVNPAYVASLLYCLIVVPKEVWDPPSNDVIYRQLAEMDPVSLFVVKKWTDSSLQDFIRDLPNAIAHVRFVVDGNRSFEFWDTDRKGENFRVSITLDNLTRFLSTVGGKLANLRSR